MGFTLVNVYAPSIRTQREPFFRSLQQYLPDQGPMIIGGDFNCVLQPHKDRSHYQRGHVTESPALQELLESKHLNDMLELTEEMPTTEGERLDYRFQHYTYFRTGVQSRLDRFYISATHNAWCRKVHTQFPPVHSDHRMVKVRLQDPNLLKQVCVKRKKPMYPPRASQKQLFNCKFQPALRRMVDYYMDQRQISCEAFLQNLSTLIKQVKRAAYRTWKARLRRKRKRICSHPDNAQKILDWKRSKLQSLTTRMYGTHLMEDDPGKKNFFKRIRNREKDHTVTTLKAYAEERFKASDNIADKMAKVWTKVMNPPVKRRSKSSLKRQYQQFCKVPHDQKLTQEQSKNLVKEIQQAEVLRAIKRLRLGKAPGCDQIPNDFYKDWQADLTPILTKIYNQLLKDPQPATSLEANIVMLRKKGDDDNGMNYRPISLLTSFYKIFARVIANRLKPVLPTMISTSQNGFVRGRRMDDTVHLMQAMLNEVPADDLPTETPAAILLLDIKKAYDSLNRDFLFEALRQFGFPATFVHLIERMHTDNTASFMVNGYRSKKIPVTSGIRQGCPLAPLLFIIAIESLALGIKQLPNVKGIQTAGIEVKFAGFVDDSAIFLNNIQDLGFILEKLVDFSELSGLYINKDKCEIILLHRYLRWQTYRGIKCLQYGKTTRYLGIQIGFADLCQINWDLRIDRIKHKLGMAIKLTNSLHQRVQLANSILTPGVIFTAKYFNPDNTIMKKITHLQLQFVVKSKLSTDHITCPLAREILYLPLQHGGLGLDHLSDLIALTQAKIVFRWRHHPTRDIQTILLNLLTGSKQLELQTTEKYWRQKHSHSWDQGAYVLGCLAYQRWAPPPQLVNRSPPLHPHQWKLQQRTSKSGWVSIATSDLIKWQHTQATIQAQMPEELQAFWWRFAFYSNPWIKPLKNSYLQDYKQARLSLKESLSIVQATSTTFQYQIHTEVLNKYMGTKAYKNFLIAVVWYSPWKRLQMWTSERIPREQVFRSLSWRTTETHSMIGYHDKYGVVLQGQIKCLETIQLTIFPSPVRKTLQDQVSQHRLSFYSAPSSAQNVYYDKCALEYRKKHHSRYEHSWTQLTQNLGSPVSKQGQTKLFNKLQRWLDNDQEIALALQTNNWSKIWSKPQKFLSAYQQSFKYRLHVGMFNLYVEGKSRICRSHETQCAERETLSHLFWSCPTAQYVWAQWLNRWIPGKDTSSYKAAIFGEHLPKHFHKKYHQCWPNSRLPLPRKASQILQNYWQLGCRTILTSLWQLRNDEKHNGILRTPIQKWLIIWKNLQQRSYSIGHWLLQAHDTHAGLTWHKLISDQATASAQDTQPTTYPLLDIHSLSRPLKTKRQLTQTTSDVVTRITPSSCDSKRQREASIDETILNFIKRRRTKHLSCEETQQHVGISNLT